ncbi:cupin domain-containing protein [Clostridium minihomine]|uniref:cupin domain-containing protein n=1 Tax=Clostridium minihomine TaxID=2045012 RepID=UPI001A910240|nr:cupin domain-containing protein [Clostridium minihomine]
MVVAIIKNLDPESVQNLADQVSYLPGQIVSRTISQNPHVSMTLFAFAEGEEISTHDSKGDAMVYVLDGTGEFTVNGEKHTVTSGQFLIMPAQKPHAVYAPKQFKMLLTVVFPQSE